MLSLVSPPKCETTAPGPEHRLDPQQLRPRGAVAEHLEPTGVGGDRAADGRAVAAAQIDPVGPPGRLRRRLDLGHRGAGFRP